LAFQFKKNPGLTQYHKSIRQNEIQIEMAIKTLKSLDISNFSKFWKVFRIGTVRYIDIYLLAYCTDSEDLPKF